MSDRPREPLPEQVPAPQEPEGGAATQLSGRPATPPPKADFLPQYRVLLHNDDHTDMLDVVEALVDLTPMDLQHATSVMMEAHTTGVALVLVTHRERAELYVDQFRSKRLTVTIEPAE